MSAQPAHLLTASLRWGMSALPRVQCSPVVRVVTCPNPPSIPPNPTTLCHPTAINSHFTTKTNHPRTQVSDAPFSRHTQLPRVADNFFYVPKCRLPEFVRRTIAPAIVHVGVRSGVKRMVRVSLSVSMRARVKVRVRVRLRGEG